MTGRCFKVIFITGLFLAWIAKAPSIQADNASEIIRTQVEQITTSGQLSIGEEGITSVSVLPELYERCGFCLLWENPDNIVTLMQEIANIGDDGLDPEDYHFTLLSDLHARIKASLKIGMTDNRVPALRKRLSISGDKEFPNLKANRRHFTEVVNTGFLIEKFQDEFAFAHTSPTVNRDECRLISQIGIFKKR